MKKAKSTLVRQYLQGNEYMKGPLTEQRHLKLAIPIPVERGLSAPRPAGIPVHDPRRTGWEAEDIVS